MLELVVGEYYEEDDNSIDREKIKVEVDIVSETPEVSEDHRYKKDKKEVKVDVDLVVKKPEVSECHRDQKDIKIDEDTSSDTTEEWNPSFEMIDIKPMDLRLSSEVDSVEELLKSSDHTDEEAVNSHKVQLPYVDLSKSKVEGGVDKKKRKRKKMSGDKWKITEQEEEERLTPAKSKQPVRIVLTKRCPPVQDDSQEEEEERITQTRDQAHSPIKD